MNVPSNNKKVSLQTHHLMRGSKPVPALLALEGEYDGTVFTRCHKKPMNSIVTTMVKFLS